MNSKILVLDGAVGTMLQNMHQNLYSGVSWMNAVLQKSPQSIQSVHLKHIKAGADMITTSTFRTNIEALNRQQNRDKSILIEQSQALVKIALEQAQLAKTDYPNVKILGSNAPGEDCYQVERKLTKEQLYENHQLHIQFLKDYGSDIILNETFGHSDEIKMVSQICEDKKYPYYMSILCDENLQLLSGEPVQQFIEKYQEQYHPLAISFNCIKFGIAQQLIQKLDFKKFKLNWGIYPNCGNEQITDEFNIDAYVTPQHLQDFVQDILKLDYKPVFIGSCCCSNEGHTQAIAQILKQN